MMQTIATIFGKSPFAPLQYHMEKVTSCVEKAKEILQKFYSKDFESIEQLLQEISALEHEADVTKMNIRNNLPKKIFLPADRGHLLEVLSLQDSIADSVENIAVVLSLKRLEPIEDFLPPLKAFAAKNFETFAQTQEIILELSQLAKASFGGITAKKVKLMIDKTALLEHEADLLQRALLKKIFNYEQNLSVQDFHIWMRLIEGIGAIADLSDKLTHRLEIGLHLA